MGNSPSDDQDAFGRPMAEGAQALRLDAVGDVAIVMGALKSHGVPDESDGMTIKRP